MQKQFTISKNFKHTEKGQSLVEYLILVALIGVGSMAAVSTLGQNLNNRFAHVIKSMGGKSQGDIGEVTVKKSIYEKKDLGSFMNDAEVDDRGK